MARVAAVLVAFAAAAFGQIQLGDNTKLSTSGSLGFGYSGLSGNYFPSSHSTGLNASGTLTGSYYNPNFLSFSMQPYYARGQESSGASSISNSKGFSSTANFFSGSRFPGSISYGRDYDTTSQYSLPGTGSLFQTGSGSAFAIGWGAHFSGLPTLSVNYGLNNSNGEVLGTQNWNQNSSRIFRLSSNYKFRGWTMNGSLDRASFSSTMPDFFTGEARSGESSSRSYDVSATHNLPLDGSFSLSWFRNEYGADTSNQYSTNNTMVSASVRPLASLSIAGTARYLTNLSGALVQDYFSGVPGQAVMTNSDSHSYSFDLSAGYTIARRVQLQAYANRNMQTFLGQSYDSTQYGGTVNFNSYRPLFGLMTVSFGVNDTANKFGNQGAGLVASVAARRRIGTWETDLDFSYYQNVQTVVAIYTTSSYNYGATVRRRLSDTVKLTAAFRGAHSGLSRQAGSGNHSENLNTNLSWRRYSLGAYYSQAAGKSVFSSSGMLVPTSIAPLITEDYIMFSGKSYGFSGSTVLFRRLVLSGGYGNSLNNTTSNLRWSEFSGNNYNGRVDFRTRKLIFRGGFVRVEQGVGASSAAPAMLNSYYFTISRWFKFF